MQSGCDLSLNEKMIDDLKKENIVVVIPVYRQMDVYERASLNQCIRVLGGYCLTLVAGLSMDLREFRAIHPFEVERFDDADFTDVMSYSRLLLSDRFYERFAAYRYMLIYQLDAFVFSDHLIDFCRMGYDYIGAPVPRWAWPWAKNRVGNGGFSLRCIDACRRVLREFPPERYFLSSGTPDHPEDQYFAGCVERNSLNFRAPTMQVALTFSVDYNLFRCYQKMPGWLPFGCHGWNKIDYWHWWPILCHYDNELPEPQGLSCYSKQEEVCQKYILKRCLRASTNCGFLQTVLSNEIPKTRRIILWGYGNYGKMVFQLFRKLGYRNVNIYDRDTSHRNFEGCRIFSLDVLESIPPSFIVVSTLLGEDAINEELFLRGVNEGTDFLKLTTLLKMVFRSYLRRF